MSRMPKDMRQLMEQAQQMQQQMMAAQEQLATKTYEGTAGGGGVVKAVIQGTGEVLSVTFDPDVLDPDDAEMAGDLVVAALNQAFAAMSEDADSSMGGLPGGAGPGGMLG